MLTMIIYILSIVVSVLNFAVRNHPNSIVGYRVDDTIQYPDIWTKIHWIAAISGGISCIAAGVCFFFLSKEALSIIVWINLFFPILVTLPFIYILGGKRRKEEGAREEQQKREAERAESM